MAASCMLENRIECLRDISRINSIELKNESILGSLQNLQQTFAASGGGYSYGIKSKITNNRNIFWRISNKQVLLEETSLNYNLSSNKLKVIVSDASAILPTVRFHETTDSLFIYIATPSAVHRLQFPHPHKQPTHPPKGVNARLPSIFQDASSCVRSCFTPDQAITDFDMFTHTNGETTYAMITDAKSLLISAPDGIRFELKEASISQRLWNGLVPSFVRGNGTSGGEVDSIAIHSFNGTDVYVFTLCTDFKIRVWNVQTKTCVNTTDLMPLIPDNLESQAEIVDKLSIRKCMNSSEGQLLLAVHCGLAYSSQIIILESFEEQNSIVLLNVSHFSSNFNTIQDMQLCNGYVWALWNTPEGDNTLTYAPIEGGESFERGWHDAHLLKTDKHEVFVPVFQDAKEVFMRRIFSPNFYEKESIITALEVYTKTNDLDGSLLPDSESSIAELKEAVVKLLDSQVEHTVMSTGTEESGYQQLQHQCWSAFYSFVQQYVHKNMHPLGLCVSSDATHIVRKGNHGHFQPMEWLDSLYQSDLDSLEQLPAFVDKQIQGNASLGEDILILIECLKAVSMQFNEEILLGLDSDLNGNEDVKVFLDAMADVLITNTSDFEQLIGEDAERATFLHQMEARLKHLKQPDKAVKAILSTLDLDAETASTNDYTSPSPVLRSGDVHDQFACGRAGVALLSQCIGSVATLRMHFCRDFYVLLRLMSRIACKIDLSLRAATDFGCVNLSTCYEMLRSYHLIVWTTAQTFKPADTSSFEANLVNMAALNLTEKSPLSKTARKIVDTPTEQLVSLLQRYMTDIGITCSLNGLKGGNTSRYSDFTHREMVQQLAKLSMQNMWILRVGASDFPQYLAAHCQYPILNEYLHFADSSWCTVNRGTVDFLLAQSYLGAGEAQKAWRHFISAARGISMKEPLLLKLIENEEGEDNKEPLVQYFIQVMRLFEQWEHPLFVISSASSAITIATPTNKHKPMLWSVIFKYHLHVQHFNEAYAAIIHNQDKSRRHDCLRHFIVTLCEKEMFKEICAYPFVGLEDEVVEIIEARARTMDITINRYYDLLYSYHVLKNNYRKAATTMYEHYCRLATEMHGLKSLQKQAKCMLACLNSLKLVDEKYAWLVRPEEKYNNNNNTITKTKTNYSQSPKRKENGEEVYYAKTTTKKKSTRTVIVEMDDIEREYLMILSRLKLVQYGKNDSLTIGPGLSAQDTCMLLSQAGLFDMAFSLAIKCKLPLTSIFQTLAAKCVNLMQVRASSDESSWLWITYNEVSASLLLTNESASQQALYLLQTYLQRYRDNKKSDHLKAAASKMFSMGRSPPSWLIKEYEFVNPAELLHLYLCYDLVIEASALSIKYINALLGVGKEHLGLHTALHATTPAVWLPYTSLDQLLLRLKNNYETEGHAQLYDSLQGVLDDYLSNVARVSTDKHVYAEQRMAVV